MWIDGNYRRNLMDMHIADDNEEYLSRINIPEYIDALKAAGVQAIMLKGRPHTGLAYFPTKVGRMHRTLEAKKFDFFGSMVQAAHEAGIAVEGYFSQIFDNDAYEQHPEWRLITADGKGMREYRGGDNFKSGRYGICCPNNEEYRAYVKACITEMCTNYDFEGIFLDMTFWPEVCYCPSCQAKYQKETGKEALPRTIDWADEEWLSFVHLREKWMTEYASFATGCVHAVKPDMTVEHQFSRITGPWVDGSTEDLADCVTYAGGDYYGGFLQQTFINKYYKNVSPNLPFIYHTSRCDPELSYHTTTKTEEELLLHVILALLHNGAFLLVDAINPDGSIVPQVYHGLMKRVYERSKPYEKLISGNLNHNVSILFASHAKYDPHEKACGVMNKVFWPDYYMNSPVGAASILRSSNIPFDVLPVKAVPSDSADVLILSHVAELTDAEMDVVEAYVKRGGNLYVSGPIPHPRLAKLLGVRVIGRTEHSFTYMSPTREGDALGLFEGFEAQAPLTIPMDQVQLEIVDAQALTVLATRTLPYTLQGMSEYAAIHSNPPGIYTKEPAVLLKETGVGRILYCASPIEMSRPYMSKCVFERMIRFLAGDMSFYSNAPKFVEILQWAKDGKEYLAAVNEQEESPIAPMVDIYVDVKGEGRKARLVSTGEALPCETKRSGYTRIYLPKLDIFHIVEIV